MLTAIQTSKGSQPAAWWPPEDPAPELVKGNQLVVLAMLISGFMTCDYRIADDRHRRALGEVRRLEPHQAHFGTPRRRLSGPGWPCTAGGRALNRYGTSCRDQASRPIHKPGRYSHRWDVIVVSAIFLRRWGSSDGTNRSFARFGLQWMLRYPPPPTLAGPHSRRYVSGCPTCGGTAGGLTWLVRPSSPNWFNGVSLKIETQGCRSWQTRCA